MRLYPGEITDHKDGFLHASHTPTGARLRRYARLAPVSPRAELMNATWLKVECCLGNRVLRDANAPVMAIEYASVPCPRCSGFHQARSPTLKQNYGNADRVRFILQEVRLDSLATAPFALARCERPSAFLDAMDFLFRTREVWLYADKPAEPSVHMLWVAGWSQGTFGAAIRDETIHRHMIQTLEIGRSLGVNFPPNFSLNGRRERATRTLDQRQNMLDAMIGSRA